MAARASRTPANDPGAENPPTPPPPTHNSGGLTADERQGLLLKHLADARVINTELEKVLEAVRAVRKRRNRMRNTVRADGFPLKIFDEILSDEERPRREVEKETTLRTSMRLTAGLPAGEQQDLFAVAVAVRTEEDEAAYWQGDGYSAGIRGLECDPAKHEVPPERIQVWQQGWNDGQAFLGDRLKKAKAVTSSRPPEA